MDNSTLLAVLGASAVAPLVDKLHEALDPLLDQIHSLAGSFFWQTSQHRPRRTPLSASCRRPRERSAAW